MKCFVIGMHRSGTSILTRFLHNVGLYVGNEDYIPLPKIGNPTGHWERDDVCSLNDTMLRSLDSTWFDITGVDVSLIAEKELKKFQQQGKEILSVLDQQQPWVIKDPRHCLTLPFWRTVVGDLLCIFIYRNPVEVAISLNKLYEFPLKFGFALWEAYTLFALKGMEGLPKYTLSHKQLITGNTLREIRSVVKFMNSSKRFNLPKPSSDLIESSLRPDLYRSKVKNWTGADVSLSSSQETLFQALESRDSKLLDTLCLPESTRKVLLVYGKLFRDYDDLNQKKPNLKARIDQAEEQLKEDNNGTKRKFVIYLKNMEPVTTSIDIDSALFSDLQSLIDNGRSSRNNSIITVPDNEHCGYLYFSASDLVAVKDLTASTTN